MMNKQTALQKRYDVLIIGSGVVGSALARELSRYQLNVAVLEKELDVCTETSGRNSGVIHAGFNNKPGSLMAKFCVEGCLGYGVVADELDIPFSRTGKLVVGFDDEDRKKLQALKEAGEQNGVPGLEIVESDVIRDKAPAILGEMALYSPMTGITNPFLYTVALAENAVQNGVSLWLNHEVTAIEQVDDGYQVQTTQGVFESRWVINCAGLFADRVARMVGIDDYTIYPCRGEYLVLDKELGSQLPLPAYPVPNIREGGLGIHLTPTTDGNILVGPSTDYIDEHTDYGTTRSILDLLMREGRKIFPPLNPSAVIRTFAGVRPKLVSRTTGGYADFVIEHRPETRHFINMVGLESPGLTAAVPIARNVISIIGEYEDLRENPSFNPCREGILSFKDQTPERQESLIHENPDYGVVVCRCEGITQAEILAAIRNPLGVTTLSGIKNRSRAMMGRCQGGYCQIRIAELIMAEQNRSEESVMLARKGSRTFVGKVRPS